MVMIWSQDDDDSLRLIRFNDWTEGQYVLQMQKLELLMWMEQQEVHPKENFL